MAALPPFSLAHLTVLELTPPEVVSLAAKLGYQYAGLRLLPTNPGTQAYPLMDEPHLLRETLGRIADTGVTIFDLEMVRLDAGFDVSRFLPVFEVGAKLEAKAILVAGTDPDEFRLMASYASLCEAALPFGFSVDLEFMPWTHVPDVASALRVVAGAAQPNGGVLVDPLHFSRSRSSLAEVAQIPRQWLHYIQICDAPAELPNTMEGNDRAARGERLLPGEGGIDLAGILSTLPLHLPISVEVPNHDRAKVLGREEWVRQALAATKAALVKIAPKTYGAQGGA